MIHCSQNKFSSFSDHPVLLVPKHVSCIGSLQLKHMSTKSDSAIIPLQMEQETCKFGLLRECIDLLQSQMLLRRCLQMSIIALCPPYESRAASMVIAEMLCEIQQTV
jgi:hypothetical protein